MLFKLTKGEGQRFLTASYFDTVYILASPGVHVLADYSKLCVSQYMGVAWIQK